jgi:hypothetical protein
MTARLPENWILRAPADRSVKNGMAFGGDDVAFAGNLGNPKGAEVAGERRLRGCDAFVLESQGKFLLAVHRSGTEDVQNGLLSLLGVVLHFFCIFIRSWHKDMHFL